MTEDTISLTGQDKAIQSVSKFSRQHWLAIAFQAMLFWLGAGLATHGLNVVLPTLSQKYGIDYAQLLLWATPASWAGIAAGYICAKTAEKWGAKSTVLVCLFFSAVSYGLLGWASSIALFVIFFSGVSFFATGCAYIAGPAIIANWFPMKKDIAFGWTTVGQNLSSAFFVPVLVFFLAYFGDTYGFLGMSGLVMLLFVFFGLFSKSTPEEAGCYPDNDPNWKTHIPSSDTAVEDQINLNLTTAGLLKSKDIWLLGIGAGGVYIVLVGVISQLIPRMMGMGYDLQTAIWYMSLSALIGTIGAPFWGWLGQKIGTRYALAFYELWWIAAIVVNLLSGDSVILLWVSLLLIGLSLGGATNLTTSIVAGKYRRKAFAPAFGIVSPIQSIVRCFSFSILAFGLNYLGGFAGAWSLLAGIGVLTAICYLLVDPTPVD
ncbi:MFS transporter [uncultured Cohaesibacter sp.]|uniref:MFS transporter n=1 Tax=uncultured Cohaesibacter sp. TaxID=1002546 RepID=UPI00292EA177|nr:MFS transporter [uncultured Cohaesibacter sp.]